MTERVLGPTGSPRRRWSVLLALTAALTTGLLWIAGAQAVHDIGASEHDRNALDSPAGGPDDWSAVYAEINLDTNDSERQRSG